MLSAAEPRELREVRDFFRRWSPSVFTFCRLFLGEATEAERTTSKAFSVFYRESTALDITGEVPPRLVGLALHELQPCRIAPVLNSETVTLESCILALDCRERAAFITRNVLGMSWPGIATVMNLSEEEVRKLWLKGMLKLRELLPHEFFGR